MLDLRAPIGWLFILIGSILTVYGFIVPAKVDFAGQAVNLNMTWGSLMGLFGLCMSLLAFRDQKPD